MLQQGKGADKQPKYTTTVHLGAVVAPEEGCYHSTNWAGCCTGRHVGASAAIAALGIPKAGVVAAAAAAAPAAAVPPTAVAPRSTCAQKQVDEARSAQQTCTPAAS